MPKDFDVIIVGSGPAGVSAAFPLVEAGLRVLMVDGGENKKTEPFAEPYLLKRQSDAAQADWLLGRRFHSLKNLAAPSPKLRIPAHAYAFNNFERLNQIISNNVVAVGSMAPGGLSNVWGCGVARLSGAQIEDYPFPASDLMDSYAMVAKRMGISGAVQDDLEDYLELDEWAEPPIEIDSIQRLLLNRYEQTPSSIRSLSFRLGRARVAALSQDRHDRQACNLSGNCLWGCHRRSLYTATQDLNTLRHYPQFTYRTGFIVEDLNHLGSEAGIKVAIGNNTESISASKVLVGAGALATTRLAMRALKISQTIVMQSAPVAAFMLWIPAAASQQQGAAFALAQLAFTTRMFTKDSRPIDGFGSLFNVSGIPVSEFTPYLPMTSRYGIDALKILLRSCVVGNFYLPGKYTQIEAQLNASGALELTGKFHEEVEGLMAQGKKQLSRAFRKLGAQMIPGSFKVAKPGADIHYGASLPMRLNPGLCETTSRGSLFGLPNIHLIDGACLSSITEKPHTLTLMANADRIARLVTHELKAS